MGGRRTHERCVAARAAVRRVAERHELFTSEAVRAELNGSVPASPALGQLLGAALSCAVNDGFAERLEEFITVKRPILPGREVRKGTTGTRRQAESRKQRVYRSLIYKESNARNP